MSDHFIKSYYDAREDADMISQEKARAAEYRERDRAMKREVQKKRELVEEYNRKPRKDR